MKTKILFLSFFLVLMSCAGLKRTVAVYDTYPATPGRLEVVQTAQKLPDEKILIGTVTVGDNGFTKTKDCTYQACLDAIQEEAKKMGGQFIYIVKITEPNPWGSTCYNIVAEIYRYK